MEVTVKEKKTFKEKMTEASDWAKWKIHTATEWCKENKDFVVVFGPVLFGSVIQIVKIAAKTRNVNEEKALKERYIYDRSSGHYYEMRRKPKTSEWLQIEQRKQNGESLGWILNDMRLLK